MRHKTEKTYGVSPAGKVMSICQLNPCLHVAGAQLAFCQEEYHVDSDHADCIGEAFARMQDYAGIRNGVILRGDLA